MPKSLNSTIYFVHATMCGIWQVAIANDGTIFVADGYCNSRVVRFSPSGKYETEYILPRGAMDVPHSLVLDECLDGLYVADRERSQVHKFSISKTSLQGVAFRLMQSIFVL